MIRLAGIAFALGLVLGAAPGRAIDVFLELENLDSSATGSPLVAENGDRVRVSIVMDTSPDGVSAYAFAVSESAPQYVAALFFVGFFNLGAWGAVYPYTSELFPTRLRASAFGMVEGVGKGAAIGGPYLFGALIDWTGDTVWFDELRDITEERSRRPADPKEG